MTASSRSRVRRSRDSRTSGCNTSGLANRCSTASAHVLKQPPGRAASTISRMRSVHGGTAAAVLTRRWPDGTTAQGGHAARDQPASAGARRARMPSGPPRAALHHRPPVYIEDGVTIHDSTWGPTCRSGRSTVAESTTRTAFWGETSGGACHGEGLAGGGRSEIEGKTVQQSVMDAGEVAPAK